MLPLAVMLLVAVSLIAGLLLEAALGQARAGAADLRQARAETAAETAVASALALRLDSAVLALPPGSVLWTGITSGADSVITMVQLLTPPFARIVAQASVASTRFRVSAGRQAVVVLAADSAAPGELWLRPAPGPWWVAVP